MDNKEIIEKLFKIAENQQKIIRKLAQIQPSSLNEQESPEESTVESSSPIKFDTDTLNQILHAISKNDKYNIVESYIKDGKAFMKAQLPNTVEFGMPDPIWDRFMAIVKDYMGPTIQFAGGQPIKMIG